jgi:hypothetical protein
MTIVRRARVEDAPRLRQLTKDGVAREAALYPEDRIAISEQGLDNLESMHRAGAVHNDLATLIAEHDGEIVGFVDARVTRHPVLPGLAGEIGDLYADDAEVREALARAAVEFLRDRGAGPVFYTDDADRPEREPWKSLGFVADTIRYALYD